MLVPLGGQQFGYAHACKEAIATISESAAGTKSFKRQCQEPAQSPVYAEWTELNEAEPDNDDEHSGLRKNIDQNPFSHFFQFLAPRSDHLGTPACQSILASCLGQPAFKRFLAYRVLLI